MIHIVELLSVLGYISFTSMVIVLENNINYILGLYLIT